MQNIPSFIGLDTSYLTANNEYRRRVHLDGAASPLAASTAWQTIQSLLPHYSSTHSNVHNSARISTSALAWAHQQILDVLGADNENYTAIFTGSGTTSAINRVARGLSAAQPERKIVFVSSMEHHANDLPHRQFGNNVIYLPLTGTGSLLGTIDLGKFQAMCLENHQQVNYVAVSSVSNVTGIQNPIAEICEIAHEYNIPVVVDAAQSVAHQLSEVAAKDIDFFTFSGHKVYTPMSPGVLIAKKKRLNELSGQDLGGGSVKTVSHFDYQMLTKYPAREESGTPNIIGAIALARVLTELQSYGFDKIENHDSKLMQQLIDGLRKIEGINIYGDPAFARTGALSFNVKNIDHGLLAAILNDYYAIAVRNECFCAHPYVSNLIKQELWELDLTEVSEHAQEAFINRKRGMVRASVSLYNTMEDVQMLCAAVTDIVTKISEYELLYNANDDGSYQHKHYQVDWRAELKF